jgi:hypothetical protein
MILRTGTIAITLANRDPRNGGRLVRVVEFVGPIEWDGIEEGYAVETLTGQPFATVKVSVPEGPFRLVEGRHRCVCDRRFLRPLVDPDNPLVEGDEELESEGALEQR